jgi:hypothetical protein
MATVTDRNAKQFRVPTSARRLLAAALLLFASIHEVFAQTNMVERDVNASPGRDVRVGIYTSIRPDCTSGPLPAIRLANPPAHGTVTVKRAMLKATNVKQCLAIDVPAFVAFYHAVPDFSGSDEFLLEITFTGGRKEVQDFRVTVSSAANGGQGI